MDAKPSRRNRSDDDRLRQLEAENLRFREVLAVFANLNAMRPPPGIPLGDWLAGVTSARAALKGAE